MASAPHDPRRVALSPKPKGRENAKDTLCRNVTIYGHCRFEDKGCAFNHDQNKGRGISTSGGKKLNVESPSFTPTPQHATLAASDPNRGGTGLSPKAAGAAPFKPKGLGSGIEFNPHNSKKNYNPNAAEWGMGENGAVQTAADFMPQGLQHINLNDGSAGLAGGMYEAFGNQTVLMAHHAGQQAQINPYAQDTSATTTPFFQSSAFSAPTNYHLYAPMGPYKTAQEHQRNASDFFIPDALREELQRKNAETLQTLPNSSLPLAVEYYHSLVPLDKTNQRNASLFGYPSWIYKTVSAKNGNYYALRRLEGFKLSNERPIRSIAKWKQLRNASLVSINDAFTSRVFNNESSLVIVSDYHPLAKTLQEVHITSGPRVQNRPVQQHVPEATLWTYLVQITSALRSIHTAGLAARLIDMTKVLVTSKGRIRLNGCGILDVVQFEQARPMQELQKDDFRQFGRLLIALGTGRPSIQSGLANAMEPFNRAFSQALRDRVYWLLNQGPDKTEGIDKFAAGLEGHLMSALDGAMNAGDQTMAILNTALEDGRIARLNFKLNAIVGRRLSSGQWVDGGERGALRLFRDYVFHQVDHNSNAVLDLAHMISCMNKLDAGTDEKVLLTSRDEQIVYVVSYKELKAELNRVFDGLRRGGGKS